MPAMRCRQHRDDGRSLGGSQAVGPRLDQLQRHFGIANTPNGLDGDGFSDQFPPSPDIGRAGVAVARAGDQEPGAGLHDQRRRPEALGRREPGGFHHDFHRQLIGGLHDIAQLTEDAPIITVLQAAEVEHHFDLVGAQIDGQFGFVGLDLGLRASEGESDHGAKLHIRIEQVMVGEEDAGWIDADGGKGVFTGLGAPAFHVAGGRVGHDERVLDMAGEVSGAELHRPSVPAGPGESNATGKAAGTAAVNQVEVGRFLRILAGSEPSLTKTTRPMLEWNIQSRAHQCHACSAPFKDRQPYHTLLFQGKQGFERRDLCEACRQERQAESVKDPNFVSHWQGIYEAPPAVAPDAIQKETAETLLRKLVERREEKYAAASYILAVMLERKRLLKVKSQLREGGRRIFVYEHGPTGDIFTIADPELQLAQLESVQRDVAALLEHGLPGEGTPEEEPFNPPSDVATLAPT